MGSKVETKDVLRVTISHTCSHHDDLDVPHGHEFGCTEKVGVYCSVGETYRMGQHLVGIGMKMMESGEQVEVPAGPESAQS